MNGLKKHFNITHMTKTQVVYFVVCLENGTVLNESENTEEAQYQYNLYNLCTYSFILRQIKAKHVIIRSSSEAIRP